jgi:hypothetical protein
LASVFVRQEKVMIVWKTLLATLCAASLFALPVTIDGKWKGEIKDGGRKKTATAAATPVTFEFKTEGDRVTGTASVSGGKRARTAEISEGKIEGNTVSFTTVQRTRKGEVKTSWTGTLEGEQLKGTRTRVGAKRGAAFTLTRQ